jgi:hypothetical protein
MSAYNPARGDVKIVLCEAGVVLRPSFQAIVQIEAHFGRGIIDVARDYHNGRITKAGDFVAIIRAGLEGAGETVPSDLGDVVMESGLAQLIEPLGQFLAHACGIKG